MLTWAQVSAAASGYLLLGWAWSGLYTWALHVDPTGSFRDPDQVSEAGGLLYFSFVTLTTLGYGDIVPVSLATRMLVVLEAIVGQLYLVILVARLVGMVGSRK